MPKQQLKSFATAKHKSIAIFKSISKTSNSTLELCSKFAETLEEQEAVHFFSEENLVFIRETIEKCSRIIVVLERNNMKCAFFGRTSNGKSTCINAILGKKIMPCGLGHTTNCFVQVQGTLQEQGFIENKENGDGGPQKCLPINSLSQLSHAFSSEKVSSDSIVYLNWPEKDCRLLRSDVIILDSPGVDMDPDMDFWIDKYCIDADVFVMVTNSESTLSKTEKQFFLKVRNRISNPFIFILNNRWDLSDAYRHNDTSLAELKAQHKQRCIDFLVTELGICTTKNAGNYVYFVSGKEVLDARIKNMNPETMKLNEYQKERWWDFEEFEQNLEASLCTHALKTKFLAHTKEGLVMIDNLIKILLKMNKNAKQLISTLSKEINDQQAQIKSIKTATPVLKRDIYKKVNSGLEGVTNKLNINYMKQVNHVGTIIRKYPGSKKFNSEPTKLLMYKTDLINYLEEQLNTILKRKNSYLIEEELKSYRLFLIQHFSKLLGQDLSNHPVAMENDLVSDVENEEQEPSGVVTIGKTPSREIEAILNDDPYQPFETMYIPCNSLLSSFKANLQFQWPLNPTRIICCLFNLEDDDFPSSLIERVYGPGFSGNILRYITTGTTSIPQRRSTSRLHLSSLSIEVNQMIPDSLMHYRTILRNLLEDTAIGNCLDEILNVFASPQFAMYVGMTLILRKAFEMNILMSSGLSYGLLYAMEKYRWNTTSMERIYRKQFTKYAVMQLSNFVNISSKNQSVMIKQEMLMMERIFQKLADTTVDQLDEDLAYNNQQMKSLVESEAAITKLKSSVELAKDDLSNFSRVYLH